MDASICSTCLRLFRHSRRGYRRAEHACPYCKTRTLRAAVWTPAGFQITEPRPRKLGRKIHCGICGRPRFAEGNNVKTVPYPFVERDAEQFHIYSANTKVCWFHAVKQVIYVDEDLLD